MSYECLKQGDGRRRALIADWERWLTAADSLYMSLLERIDYAPFLLHEITRAGLLACAASQAGFLPLMEYALAKKGRDDKRLRENGRADLWFASNASYYSFEFKCALDKVTPGNLAAKLDHAARDIACIPPSEYRYAAGCLIAPVVEEERLETYRAFAQSDAVDCAYRIGPDGADGAFLFFRMAG